MVRRAAKLGRGIGAVENPMLLAQARHHPPRSALSAPPPPPTGHDMTHVVPARASAQHQWLEASDRQHRYGGNLFHYYALWTAGGTPRGVLTPEL